MTLTEKIINGMTLELKEKMSQENLTVKELSKRSGVAASTIYAVLNGKVQFRLTTIANLFEPFGIDCGDALEAARKKGESLLNKE